MALFENILKSIDKVAQDDFVALWVVDTDEVIIVDATISVNHGFRKEITDYPVEDGANKSDHIIDKAQPVTITGIISDDHISLQHTYEELSNALDSDSVSRSKKAYDIFQSIKKTNSEIQIHTKYEDYESMYLQSFQLNETSEIQNAIRFSAVFKRIEFATVKLTQNAGDTAGTGTGTGKAGGVKDNGNQTTDGTTEADKKKAEEAARKASIIVKISRGESPF